MELSGKHCVPCEGGGYPLSQEDEDRLIKKISDWNLHRENIHKINRVFQFKDFLKAIEFVNNISKVAEKEGHHPDIHIYYNKVEIDLYTHAVKRLSENDFIMAAKIDLLKTT